MLASGSSSSAARSATTLAASSATKRSSLPCLVGRLHSRSPIESGTARRAIPPEPPATGAVVARAMPLDGAPASRSRLAQASRNACVASTSPPQCKPPSRAGARGPARETGRDPRRATSAPSRSDAAGVGAARCRWTRLNSASDGRTGTGAPSACATRLVKVKRVAPLLTLTGPPRDLGAISAHAQGATAAPWRGTSRHGRWCGGPSRRHGGVARDRASPGCGAASARAATHAVPAPPPPPPTCHSSRPQARTRPSRRSHRAGAPGQGGGGCRGSRPRAAASGSAPVQRAAAAPASRRSARDARPGAGRWRRFAAPCTARYLAGTRRV